jgi:hypothetical protein
MTSLLTSSGRGQSVPHSVLTPIQAELLADVQARNLVPGALLHAKVQADWNGFGCVLPRGVVLEAQVVSVVKHSQTDSARRIVSCRIGSHGDRRAGHLRIRPEDPDLESVTRAGHGVPAGRSGVRSLFLLAAGLRSTP